MSRIDELERQVQVLVAKEEIREVLHRYARGVDRKDVELLKACYHPDSIDAHWSFIGNGEEFAEEIVQPHQMGQIPIYKHYITNVLIELDGDRAFCESSYLFTQTVHLESDRTAWLAAEGRYLDIFERRDGVWRIYHRLLVAEAGGWLLPVPMGGVDLGDRPLPTATQFASDFPHDPVYRGFGISEILPEAYRTTDDTWRPSIEHLRRLVAD
jgi:hypothetical protein